MSRQKPPVVVPEDARIRGSPRREQELRGAAILHQQRRLKQSTQFLHKDSADLLPLDQLRRLGTSKDLQPHTVVQRRLLGGSPIKESRIVAQPPLHLSSQVEKPANKGAKPAKKPDAGQDPPTEEQPEPPNTSEGTKGGRTGHKLLISCKVCSWDVTCKLSVEHDENHISRSCAQRLGLEVSHDPPERVTVEVEVGSEKLTSSAMIVDDNSAEFSMGLDTLITLQSCIDLKRGVLKTPKQEVPFLAFPNNHPKTEKTVTAGEP